MHYLCTGVTLSGKTTLARYFARHYRSLGKTVIVYDPVGSDTAGGGWGEGARVYDEQLAFLDFMHSKDAHSAFVFVDEADELFSVRDADLHWMFKRGRHFGLSMWAITQRPKLVAPTVRNQCGQAFIFRLAQDDMKEIAADYGHSDLHKLSLDSGDYLAITSGTAKFSRGNIFDTLKGSS